MRKEGSKCAKFARDAGLHLILTFRGSLLTLSLGMSTCLTYTTSLCIRRRVDAVIASGIVCEPRTGITSLGRPRDAALALIGRLQIDGKGVAVCNSEEPSRLSLR